MARKKTKEQIRYNMSRVRNKGTALETMLSEELKNNGITTFVLNDKSVLGNPDITFPARKIAVFCDGDFWHGYNWETAKHQIKSNKSFWIPKIEKTMKRDLYVTNELQSKGWTVFRFWGHEIKKDTPKCVATILTQLRTIHNAPYRMIDLCAGIGGIRRGVELTGKCENVLSAEIDEYACETYKCLFDENPKNDLTSTEFKTKVSKTEYDFLLAGFPCQTFSRVGLEEGFEDETKGKIFFHIAEIIKTTRPIGFFLENVERLISHNNGETFKTIATTLVNELGYYVIGIEKQEDGSLKYCAKDFIRNSKDFGVPQNRPRTYIIGFDTERFDKEKLAALPKRMPLSAEKVLYDDLNEVLEHDVDARYYLGAGYLDTLVRHRERQRAKGYGFGYRVVNAADIVHPIANTLLATGGSGRERNLIYDPREGIAGQEIKGKKTPLNDRGIRVMTPNEWGKLQGFVNYAFIENDIDKFAFPDDMPNVQRYKQFGNAVTIPVVEEMARFILRCMNILLDEQ